MRPVLVRTLALDIVARVLERGELADFALHRALRAHKELHSTERRLVSESAYAVLRGLRRLDAHLATALGPLDRISTPDLLRLRYCAALALDLGEPLDTAISRADVERWRKPLAKIADTPVFPADPTERLAVEASLPDWLARRLAADHEDPRGLLLALAARAPLTLRTNTLKTTRDALLKTLAAENVDARPGTLTDEAITLDGRPNVFSLESFKSGLFEVQDEGSQLIALATGARPGQLVVDACAGGGGKTLALAAMMKNKGRVVACDVHARRLEDLKPRARRAGVFLVDERIVDDTGKSLANIKGKADVVLVDAPCSGTGALRRQPDARWHLTEAQTDTFPATQRAILERSALLVKPGGRLVYATCSLFRAENEQVADAFLAAHPEFTGERLALPASVLDAGGRLATRPDRHGTDGFFAAAFRRA